MEDGNFSEIEIFVHPLHSWLSIMIMLGIHYDLWIIGSYPEWISEKEKCQINWKWKWKWNGWETADDLYTNRWRTSGYGDHIISLSENLYPNRFIALHSWLSIMIMIGIHYDLWIISRVDFWKMLKGRGRINYSHCTFLFRGRYFQCYSEEQWEGNPWPNFYQKLN